ncbi:MAG: ImmA/IrrE family metallo-endopeptidase [Culicoidibacterales bacterium]
MLNKPELFIKAIQLRNRLGEGESHPVDIFSLVHTIENLTIVFYPMGDKMSGMCVKNVDTPVIAINSSMSIGRQRFSLAHELYHLYYDENEHMSISTKKIGSGNDIERQADQFASYFLMPPVALAKFIEKRTQPFGVSDIVALEQHFGMSRQALLYRLIQERYLTTEQANKFRKDVIQSATELGYDTTLYKPLPEEKKYMTYGYYIQCTEELYEAEHISTGKYEELLLDAFRADIVYGDETDWSDLND